MDFKRATDILGKSISLRAVGEQFGYSGETMKAARVKSTSPHHRPPPAGWQRAVITLARRRARELDDLAFELERELDAAKKGSKKGRRPPS